MKIDQLGKKLRGYKTAMENTTDKILREEAGQLRDINIDQMQKGKNRLDEQIGEYSPVSVEIKKIKGQEYRFITLEDKGDYHESIELIPTQKNVLTYKSDPVKTGDRPTNLEEEFPNILGITEENLEDYATKVIAEDLFKKLKAYFN